jgi:hypothetical protein
MPYFVDNTKHWKERAQEARALAATLTDPVSRRAMEEIADAYERMAARAEAREAKSSSEAAN